MSQLIIIGVSIRFSIVLLLPDKIIGVGTSTRGIRKWQLSGWSACLYIMHRSSCLIPPLFACIITYFRVPGKQGLQQTHSPERRTRHQPISTENACAYKTRKQAHYRLVKQ